MVVDAIGAIDRLEIEAGGFTFTGRACGPHDGRKVLLLHGFPQTSWAWRDELWALGRAGYRAIAPDQRGYCIGARPAEVGDYATEHLLHDVVALADAMDMETFDLVGHDWGGMLAWIVASRHPGRVRTLSVVSTPHPLALARGAPRRRSHAGRLRRLHGCLSRGRRAGAPVAGRRRCGSGPRHAAGRDRPRRRGCPDVCRRPDRTRGPHGGPQLVPGHGRQRPHRAEPDVRAHALRLVHRGRRLRVGGRPEHRRARAGSLHLRGPGQRVALDPRDGAGRAVGHSWSGTSKPTEGGSRAGRTAPAVAPARMAA